MAITPHQFPNEQQYLHQRYEDFSLVEGAIPRVYTDSRGIPTVSIGYALLIETGGRFVVRDNWQQVLTNAGVNLAGVNLNTPQQMFDQVAGILNGGGANAVAQAQQIIPAWTAGENSANPNLNTTGIPLLTDPQMETLFDQSIGEYENILSGRIGATLVGQLARSWELIALLSLTYNSPSLIGPGLTRALQGGDRPEAWFQIRDYSNGSNSAGIAKRRYFEAYNFGLYNNTNNITQAEANSVLDMYNRRRNIIDPYESRFSNMIPLANRDYRLNSPNVVLDLNGSFAPARAVVG